MPELPDLTVYVERLSALVGGTPLERVEIRNPFVLRTVTPPITDLVNRRVSDVSRLGKRVVISVEGDLHMVIHLMIAGRLRWRPATKPIRAKYVLAVLQFDTGSLHLTEAGTQRRASIHVVAGEVGLQPFRRGGLEPLVTDVAAFSERLRSENHTLKRSLTDPRLFSGIGNAYSDEILHRARLSPLMLTTKLTDSDIATLFAATGQVLTEWTDRIRDEVGAGFPEEVTAFRPDFAVHGRYRLPCPECGKPVQRIRYASNETNYCAQCQTGGRLLADRAMSRLLKQDWPRTLDELE